MLFERCSRSHLLRVLHNVLFLFFGSQSQALRRRVGVGRAGHPSTVSKKLNTSFNTIFGHFSRKLHIRSTRSRSLFNDQTFFNVRFFRLFGETGFRRQNRTQIRTAMKTARRAKRAVEASLAEGKRDGLDIDHDDDPCRG